MHKSLETLKYIGDRLRITEETYSEKYPTAAIHDFYSEDVKAIYNTLDKDFILTKEEVQSLVNCFKNTFIDSNHHPLANEVMLKMIKFVKE